LIEHDKFEKFSSKIVKMMPQECRNSFFPRALTEKTRSHLRPSGGGTFVGTRRRTLAGYLRIVRRLPLVLP